MNKMIALIIFATMTAVMSGQNDPEAIKILDRFSSIALSSPSVSIKFNLITINQPEQKNDTVAGSLIMAKDQYRLEMPDNITWYNGSFSWNYLIREKEVTITRPGKKDDSFMSRPSSIFTLYKKGYKTRLVEENSKTYIIDLYPEDLKNDLIRIRLAIGRSNDDLVEAEYKRKDGIVIYLVVNDYNLKTKPETSDFTFDSKKYKDVEVNDMR
ncbi:MAG: LolA-like putative outer membrane lipoprotein chaperone [Bacteroidales bacterium]